MDDPEFQKTVLGYQLLKTKGELMYEQFFPRGTASKNATIARSDTIIADAMYRNAKRNLLDLAQIHIAPDGRPAPKPIPAEQVAAASFMKPRRNLSIPRPLWPKKFWLHICRFCAGGTESVKTFRS